VADDATFTNPLGEVMTKEQRLSQIKPGGIQFDSYTADDVNVRVYGDTAVVTSRDSLAGKRGDQDISGQYRVTSIFVKKGGNWQLVARQSTRIAEPPTKP
jgi:ketosteroid isomerase-like protein